MYRRGDASSDVQIFNRGAGGCELHTVVRSVQFQRSRGGGQGQGLHKVWPTGPLAAGLGLLAGRVSTGFCLGASGRLPGRAAAASDFCLSIRRMDFVRGSEPSPPPPPLPVLLLLRTPGSGSERERLAARDAASSAAAPSQRPLPSAPRNRAAACRQVEKPSWRECVRPPSPPPEGGEAAAAAEEEEEALVSSPSAVLRRKRTVCSRISAFSTRC